MYGWSGEAVKHITDALTEMKFKVLNGGLRVRFAPTPEDLEKCVDLGRQIGKEVRRAKV